LVLIRLRRPAFWILEPAFQRRVALRPGKWLNLSLPAESIPQDSSSLFNENDLMGRVYGDLEMARIIAGAFVMDMPEQMAALKAGLTAGDAAAVRLRAHTIKGSAANVGAESLRQKAYVVEKHAERGDLALAASLAPQIDVEFERLKQALTQKGYV
jgi:HPt (histidine-containing phosphotransfer) domain-containing protein